MNGFFDGDGDLFRQTFLDLQTTTEGFSDSGEFGQSENKFVRDVTNCDLISVKFSMNRRETGGPNRKLTLPVNGTKWCSQRLEISMSLTSTISS